MIVFGGLTNLTTKGPTNDAWKFNVASSSWMQISASGIPVRCAHGAVYYGGSMYIFGGANYAASTVFNDVEELNVNTGAWSQVNPGGVSSSLPAGRCGFAIESDGSGNIVIFGGDALIGSSLCATNDVWKFNIGGNSWTAYTPGIIPGRAECAYISDGSGNMVIFGGSTNYSTTFSGYNDVWKINLSTGVLSELSSTGGPGAREAGGVYYSANNSMIIFGGDNGTYIYNGLWNYNLTSQTWYQIGPLNNGIYSAAAKAGPITGLSSQGYINK